MEEFGDDEPPRVLSHLCLGCDLAEELPPREAFGRTRGALAGHRLGASLQKHLGVVSLALPSSNEHISFVSLIKTLHLRFGSSFRPPSLQ